MNPQPFTTCVGSSASPESLRLACPGARGSQAMMRRSQPAACRGFDSRRPLFPANRVLSEGWVAVGLTNEEIARRLWLSPHTVRKHLENR
jgi:DNA-binding NarL/FixJ family response regulator